MLKTVALHNIFVETKHIFQDALINKVQKISLYLKIMFRNIILVLTEYKCVLALMHPC